MQIINNQAGNDIGYIRNNIIFSNDDTVIGIKIGDCCFGKAPGVIGKIINGFIYTLEGTLIGQCQQHSAPNEKFATKEQLTAAWEILSGIDDHTCPWITLTDNWSVKSFQDHLID
jgi:hypothetical protein